MRTATETVQTQSQETAPSSNDDSSNSQTTPTSTTSDSPTTTQAVPASAYSGFLSQYVMAILGKVTTSPVLNAAFSSVTMSVAFKSFWCVVLASAKMMEASYQLFRSSGASAFDSLTIPYLEGGVTWKSLNPMNKQWVILLTTGISLKLSLLALIASESMTGRAGSTCIKNGGKTLCDPEVRPLLTCCHLYVLLSSILTPCSMYCLNYQSLFRMLAVLACGELASFLTVACFRPV
jgi:hypothetical protein